MTALSPNSTAESGAATTRSTPVPVVRCIGLSRWYGEVQGLSGLDLEIQPGILGLLGPNGSGKSTFMRLLTGLIRPSRGYVELFGQRVNPKKTAMYAQVGHSPGDDVHFESERAVDFLSLLASLGGDFADDSVRRADHALDQVGLLNKREVRLDAMSKGMRQRVKVAQALLFDPQLLLLDEPLNGMDPISRRQTLDLISRYGEAGRTVILASHVLHEVEAVTDRLILLHHGRLLAEGRLAEIRELVDRKPRQVVLSGGDLRQIAASVLAEDLVTGINFDHSDRLVLETRDLPTLIQRLNQFGQGGSFDGLEIEDENLEAVFDLLVGETA
jgi:ABC-2 type transport system ATP-binding protein